MTHPFEGMVGGIAGIAARWFSIDSVAGVPRRVRHHPAAACAVALLVACGSPSDSGATASRSTARALRLQGSQVADGVMSGAADGVAALDAGFGADGGAASSTRRAQLDALIQPLLDDEWLLGVSIALIDHGHVETHGFGATQAGGPAPDGQTLFEIGSVTKTFTSLFLADLVREGRVELDQPVASLLPTTVQVPELNGRAITLLDLATHTSGLPRLPTNLVPADPSDPYADYEVSDLYEFLSSYTLAVEPGSVAEYSNLGVGLLGHALSLAAGTTYEQAICDRITAPLGMRDTSILQTREQRARLTQGHDVDLVPVPDWLFTDASEGAGALRSSAEDLARYIVAELEAGKSLRGDTSNPDTSGPDAASPEARALSSPLAESMALTQAPHLLPGGTDTMGLAWFMQGADTFLHSGGTYGNTSIVFFDRALDVGGVILANSFSNVTNSLSTPVYVLLAGSTPTPLALPPFVRLPVELLDRYTGSYAPLEAPFLVERDGERLILQSGDARIALYASATTTFLGRSFDITVHFTTGPTPAEDSLTFDLDGESYTLPRAP
jgi:D-alanyl-D-alanine-carboxypeptidase/D-alanyl-D-alanine-endopeptidase